MSVGSPRRSSLARVGARAHARLGRGRGWAGELNRKSNDCGPMGRRSRALAAYNEGGRRSRSSAGTSRGLEGEVQKTIDFYARIASAPRIRSRNSKADRAMDPSSPSTACSKSRTGANLLFHPRRSVACRPRVVRRRRATSGAALPHQVLPHAVLRRASATTRPRKATSTPAWSAKIKSTSRSARRAAEQRWCRRLVSITDG